MASLKSILKLIGQSLAGDNTTDFTRISINRAIVLLSIPMIIEMGMESLFAVVDMFFVSKLHDPDALAVVAFTESILTLVYSIAMGLSMGATAMVARRIGEKDVPGAEEAGFHALAIGVGFSIVISLVGMFFTTDLLRLMGASERLISEHSGYASWMLCGNLTIVLLFLNNAIFRGAGDATIAMRALLLANGLNMVLDPIFIFGWGPIPAFGVTGAAIATNVGRGIGVVYQMYHLSKGNGVIHLHWANMKWIREVAIRIVSISAGGTGQFLIGSASWVFLVWILGKFGSIAMAGYTVGIRIIIFAILPAWGMANAASTLVGQNLGAGEPGRAEKAVWQTTLYNMVFLGIVTIVFYTLAAPIVGIFTKDPAIIKEAVLCLQVVSLGYIFYAAGMVVNQSFNGAGDTVTPTIISICGFWLFQIPLAYVLAITLKWGPTGVYAAIGIAETAMAIAGVLIFRRGKWKTIKI